MELRKEETSVEPIQEEVSKEMDAKTDDAFSKTQEKIREDVMSELRDTFRPEFLNRIDDIIVFEQLDAQSIRTIAGKLLEDVSKRLAAMDITVRFADDAIDFLVEKGYNANYGARPLKRAIQTFAEDRIAEEMLAGNIRAKDTVTAHAQDGKIVFEKDGAADTANTKSSEKPENE